MKLKNYDSFKAFLEINFQTNQLHQPLFYNTEAGLRFEMGSTELDIDDPKYIKMVYLKSILLFQEIFGDNDDVFLVINTTKNENTEFLDKDNTNAIASYFRNNSIYQTRTVENFPYFYDKEDSTTESIRYSFKCKLKDIKYKNLLKAIANKDIRIKPYVTEEVYFVHIEKKIIYNLYDDRGLDIVAATVKPLKNIYEKYDEWILGYDKSKIDEMICKY